MEYKSHKENWRECIQDNNRDSTEKRNVLYGSGLWRRKKLGIYFQA